MIHASCHVLENGNFILTLIVYFPSVYIQLTNFKYLYVVVCLCHLVNYVVPSFVRQENLTPLSTQQLSSIGQVSFVG